MDQAFNVKGKYDEGGTFTAQLVLAVRGLLHCRVLNIFFTRSLTLT